MIKFRKGSTTDKPVLSKKQISLQVLAEHKKANAKKGKGRKRII